MADVLPQSSRISTVGDRAHKSPGSEMLYSQSALCTPPEPNPPFCFPLQAATTDAVNLSEHPLRVNGGRTRRPASRPRPHELSINNLPFEFYPSTTSSATTLPGSPDRSPITNSSFPSHPSGHRRNGSEFIGGDGRSGGPGLISTSPTKGEGVLPIPTNSRPSTAGNRRGHAHRRSDAISSHDLSMILKSSNQQRGNSAPTTPCIPTPEPEHPPKFARAASQPVITESSRDSLTSADGHGSCLVGGSQRPRVGFSDTVEFIPRPLSTISSESSSSFSTSRATHSVTGSITSIISASASSPPSKKGLKIAVDQSRPRTSGPAVSFSQSQHSQELSVHKRPSSASAAERPSNEVDGFQSSTAWASLSGNEYLQVTARSDSDLPLKGTEPFQPSTNWESSRSQPTGRPPTPSTVSLVKRPRDNLESKTAKRQTNVKAWAGSILSRRARPRDIDDNSIAPTTQTPFSEFAPESDFCLDNINFDEDTTCVIQTPPAADSKQPDANSDISARRTCESSSVQDSDGSLSVLDLDATFSSFDRLDLEADPEYSAAKGFSIARRRMHSSGATGGFSGPGMHYHRRAESAPEMMAINYQTFGFPRLGSNPAMADVFEEEEEETDPMDLPEEAASSHQEDLQDNNVISGLGVEIVDVDSENTENTSINRKLRAPTYEQLSSSRVKVRQEPSLNSLASEFLPEEFGGVEIVNGDEEPRFSVVTKSSDDSTITPTLSYDALAVRPASAPIDFAIPKPALHYATPESSSYVSSPDFSKSSFDTPRMHTANSSITDRVTMSSSRTCEHGRSMRDSVDDVPSLISCPSTVGSTSAARGSCTVSTQPVGDRLPPLPASGPIRPRYGNSSKRSSLASIKFFGSHHGERSKLNIEERAPSESGEKGEKKKGNRISRLMRFWKSKEKLCPT